MNTPNLVDILKQKTEPKTNHKVDLTDFAQQESGPTPNNDDFEEKPPVEEEKVNTEENTQAEFTEKEPQLQKSSKPRVSEEEYRNSAKMCIALVDGLQVISLPWLYQKSMFTKEELKNLKEINKRKKAAGSSGEETYTDADLVLLDKYSTFEELKENIPFTENEIELVENPLTQIFSKYNLQPGPEFALISAAFVVLAPRFLPLLTGLEK